MVREIGRASGVNGEEVRRRDDGAGSLYVSHPDTSSGRAMLLKVFVTFVNKSNFFLSAACMTRSWLILVSRGKPVSLALFYLFQSIV